MTLHGSFVLHAQHNTAMGALWKVQAQAQVSRKNTPLVAHIQFVLYSPLLFSCFPAFLLWS
jgi:hypothetical protein